MTSQKLPEAKIQKVREAIAVVPNFPKNGIMFLDITPLLSNPEAFEICMELFESRYRNHVIDAIMGIEARGFIFGAVLAHMLKVPFVPVRKHKKLPGNTLTVEYEKEYGKDTVEIQKAALRPGEKVLVIDDLIGTGGSAEAAVSLANQAGTEVIEVACLIELTSLKGREKLSTPLFSIIKE